MFVIEISTGTLLGTAAADYHAIEALSASGAKMLLRSPAHYLAGKAKPMQPSPAMKLGTVVHTLILEPEKAAAEIAVCPKFDLRTTFGKKGQADFEASAEGKLVVNEDVYDRAARIADSVRGHGFVREQMLSGGGEAEAVMLWRQYDVACKCRMDMLKGATIFDVKTCQDASPDGFARQIATYSYHVQAAHYAAGYREVTGWDLDRFVFVAVESEAPYAVGIYALDPRSLQSGRILMARAGVAYKRALEMMANGEAPATYGDELIEIGIPGWAQVEPFSV